jgi:hypothetical protein
MYSPHLKNIKNANLLEHANWSVIKNKKILFQTQNHSNASKRLFGWQITLEPFHFHVSYTGRLQWNELNNLLIHLTTFPNTIMISSCIKATTTCSTTKWTQKRKPCSHSCWNFYMLIDGEYWSSTVQQPAAALFLHPALGCQEWTISGGQFSSRDMTNKAEIEWQWWPYLCNFNILEFDKQNCLIKHTLG